MAEDKIKKRPRISPLLAAIGKVQAENEFSESNVQAEIIAEDIPLPQKTTTPESRAHKAGEYFRIATDDCTPWEHSDRLPEDFGDLERLIESIKEEGQQQPALLRPLPYSDAKIRYEIIFGVRRWHACKALGIELLARIEDLSDREAADRMISENLRRENLSEFSRCKSYKNLLDSGIYKDQKDLAQKVGMSPQAISDLFVFTRLPKNILDEIKDFTKVSINTAKKLYQLRLEPELTRNLSKISEGIRKGEINQSNLARKLQNKPESEKQNAEQPFVFHGPNKQKYLEVKRDAQGNVTVKIDKEFLGDHSVESIYSSIKAYFE